MTKNSGAVLKAWVSSVTDIMNEPIAESGLQSRFEFMADKILAGTATTENVIAEALGTRSQIAELARAAERISGAIDATNVFDFRSGRPVKIGGTLKWEIIHDAAPNRYSTGFAILEISGPRAQIERLYLEAARIFA